jgi:hypothetical protein
MGCSNVCRLGDAPMETLSFRADMKGGKDIINIINIIKYFKIL